MGVPEVLIILGLGCAAVEQLNAKGRSIGWWGVILICVALLWGSLITT